MSLRWTRPAAATAIVALAIGPVAAWLDRPGLAVASSLVLMVVLADAIFLAGRGGHARIEIAPARLTEGQDCQVEVRGTRLRPSQQLRLELANVLRITGGSNLITAEQTNLAVATHVRGPHLVGPLMLRSWSPLRLWAHERALPGSATVEVVPKAANPEDVRLRSRVVTPVQGRFQVNRPGQGFDFFTLRDYHSGDTMRSINWKATARRDDLIVNQRQTETLSELTLLLDARAVAGLGPAGRTPLDEGCRIMLGLFEDALANRDEVHFLAYGNQVHDLGPIRQDRLARLEGLLATIPAEGQMTLAQAWQAVRTNLTSRTGPVVIVTSAEADATIPDAVRSMAAQGNFVTVITVAPTDDALPGRRAQRASLRREVLQKVQGSGANVVEWSPEAAR